MNATLAALLILDINSPRRRLHYHCTTHAETADQTGGYFSRPEQPDERNTNR